MLNFVRYLVVWNPIIFIIINLTIHFIGIDNQEIKIDDDVHKG